VGSLDYKIIVAERADDLYAWLKENKYSYSGDEATLDYYIKKKWFFTVRGWRTSSACCGRHATRWCGRWGSRLTHLARPTRTSTVFP
jgi:hypothetical protein